jgi:uncharacterized protein with PIN domain
MGIPRTEIGSLRLHGREIPKNHIPIPGDKIEIQPIRRPQPLSSDRFLLDVHLGTLARRMRLLGLDTAYRNQAEDDQLVDQAIREDRVLLTRDRGILRRRRLPIGAYVRGDRPEDQLFDVLDRFAPALAPWTRCLACNGVLDPVELSEIAHQLRPGTLRTYDTFAHCTSCGRPYWRGAHADRLEAVVDTALRCRA